MDIKSLVVIVVGGIVVTVLDYLVLGVRFDEETSVPQRFAHKLLYMMLGAAIIACR